MRNWVLVALVFAVLFGGFSSASATHPAKIVSGVVSNVISALVKWLWSQKFMKKTDAAVSNRPMMKFEGGYTVETVFDGSKLGIEPYSVETSPSGELLLLDSENSNIYKISTPLSRYGRPKLVAGSSEGYSGHIDGKPREARMNHPKGLTVDDRGNIYIADTKNMAIRKITDSGVTTIAGGAWGRGAGHVDGPSEDAKFSNDFDLVYIRASCSLLVIDRGNQAIREIQLNDEDCSSQYDNSFHLGIAVLVAAGLLGYMLALMLRRLRAMFSSRDDSRSPIKKVSRVASYQRPPESVRPPLIPPEDEPERPEEGFFVSMGKLVLNTGSSLAEIFGGLFSGSRRKPLLYHQHYQQLNEHSRAWPMQESFVIPDEDEPPSIETRPPTPKKAYPFINKDLETSHHTKQSQAYHNGWDGDYRQQQLYRQDQQQQHHMQHQQQQQHGLHQQHHRHFSTSPQTYPEKRCKTNDIVFGAVQQAGQRGAVVIKAVDYGDPIYNHRNIRPRLNYTSYPH
ncbi:hypothetical protein I3760_04G023200 [Carya illinoinensis]|nr:hypothetical protein I3760_04G023200 [Carya illinoinensis]